MFQKMVWWLLALLFDQRGEGEAEGQEGAAEGDGQSEAPGDAGQGNAPGAEGEGDPEPDPIITEFGEIPQDPKQFQEYLKNNVYSKYSKVKGDFDNLRNKSGLTERNLSALRKTAEANGLQIVQDANSPTGYRLEVNKPQTERQRKFQDAHKALFEPKVLEAIDYFLEDRFSDLLDTREKTYREKAQAIRLQNQLFDESSDLMFSHFPQLDGKWDKSGKTTNPDFDQAFHDRVFEVYESEYKNDPRGQLLAALRVAKELNVIPQAIKKAEGEGFKKGQEGKKILGPAGGKSAGKPTGKKLSEAEYLKLLPDDRLKYDKQQAGL